ncbi:CPBP family intramembrane metalloprotease [Klugiella xanthotipulae]|nr:CPBP family intramembrane glutamic endopeptidase [Klugiella xanthotipulae]
MSQHGHSPARIATDAPGTSRARVWWEIAIVLALSLGASALQALVSIVDLLTRSEALAEQSTALNSSVSERPLIDLAYQLLRIIMGLAPVALVCFLAWSQQRPRLSSLGLHGRPRGSDLGLGLLLAAIIGIPGLALYCGARALGLNANVIPTSLGDYWWTVPVLILAALKAALLEEIIVVGYLFDRLRQLGWKPWTRILASALLRGSYHLYQGFGGFIGNVAMGIIFGWFYERYGRTLPLIIAHWILDIVSFVGYAWAVSTFPSLF